MSTQSLTDQLRQLEEEITRLHEKATPGPWIADTYDDAPYVWSKDPEELLAKTWLDDRVQGAANRDFIAFARTALLDLLAVSKGLEKQVQTNATMEKAHLAWAHAMEEELAALRAENERQAENIAGLKFVIEQLNDEKRRLLASLSK